MNYYNYFTEIEETFVRRRARNLFLSPLDWALMETWQEKGIPLHVVIRAIEQVFDNFEKNPGPRSIKGLMFCREEVEAQFTEWLKGQAGKNDTAEEQGPGFGTVEAGEHIDGLIASLRLVEHQELCEDIERVCMRLAEIRANLTDDLGTLDMSLKDVESLLDEVLMTKCDRALFSAIEKEVVSQVKPYKSGMDANAYKEMTRLMILKRLREEYGLPRISLFYL